MVRVVEALEKVGIFKISSGIIITTIWMDHKRVTYLIYKFVSITSVVDVIRIYSNHNRPTVWNRSNAKIISIYTIK